MPGGQLGAAAAAGRACAGADVGTGTAAGMGDGFEASADGVADGAGAVWCAWEHDTAAHTAASRATNR